MRTLLITERVVSYESLHSYHTAWHAYHEAAEGAGARVWIFRAADDRHRFMEFLEWRAGHDVAVHEAVASAAAALEKIAAAVASRTWEEWTGE